MMYCCYGCYRTDEIHWNEISTTPQMNISACKLSSESITVEEGVRSVKLKVCKLKTVEFKKPERIFRLLISNMQRFSEKELSRFARLEYVQLVHLPNLTDISPFHQVPVIIIISCHSIQNFSCLGKSQRYLTLDWCNSLCDRDLASFGSIHTLHVRYCQGITRIADTEFYSNDFLMIVGCHNNILEWITVFERGNSFL
jgi:hypothetical protein